MDSRAAFPRDHKLLQETSQQGPRNDKGFRYVRVKKLRDLRGCMWGSS